MYACQLQYWDENFKKVTFYLEFIYLKEKKYYNDKYNICIKKPIVEQVVLQHDTRCKKHMF